MYHQFWEGSKFYRLRLSEKKNFDVSKHPNVCLKSWLTTNSPSFARRFPSHTSDNKGQSGWADFFPPSPFPFQSATVLVNVSRRTDSIHHLTMIRTRPHRIQVEPAHSMAATHLYMQQNLTRHPQVYNVRRQQQAVELWKTFYCTGQNRIIILVGEKRG